MNICSGDGFILACTDWYGAWLTIYPVTITTDSAVALAPYWSATVVSGTIFPVYWLPAVALGMAFVISPSLSEKL